jgi:hypothetical protein
MPLQIEGARRLPVRTGLVGLLALAVIAILAYLLASQAPAPVHTGSHATASRTHHHPPPTPAATSVTASPTQTLLPIATAQAFGPAGLSQGDNPQGASLAIDGNPGTAWHTDWYAQANVNGKPGTGLLLDLGNTVNVSSVQLMLGPAAGGTVQLRAGNAPSLAELPVIAQAAIPGGTMTLQPGSPASARYVLIWFTQLPPDSAGTYQAYVYNVSVSGTT